jgi:hypothetical protein
MPCTADSTSAERSLPPPPAVCPPHRRRRTGKGRALRRFAMVACAVVTLGSLAACSVPNLSMSSNVRKTKAPASKTRASVRPTSAKSTTAAATTVTRAAVKPTRAAVRPAGDLDTGSVTHKVAVGAFSAVIVYFTADNAKLYRASSTKTVRVAVHLEGASSKQNILVNNFVATADDGVTRVNVKQDTRSFAITPPQSYNSVVTIPGTADKTAAVKLIVELDFSLQITPKSSLYAAQTALDSITIPLLSGSHS